MKDIPDNSIDMVMIHRLTIIWDYGKDSLDGENTFEACSRRYIQVLKDGGVVFG